MRTSRAGTYATYFRTHCSPLPRHARASMYSMCTKHGARRRKLYSEPGQGRGAFSAAAQPGGGYGALRMDTGRYATYSIAIGPRGRQWGMRQGSDASTGQHACMPLHLSCVQRHHQAPSRWKLVRSARQMAFIGTPLFTPPCPKGTCPPRGWQQQALLLEGRQMPSRDRDNVGIRVRMAGQPRAATSYGSLWRMTL